ncbi:hypothetical protein D0Y65_048702 [Glycine soja]|uniref:Uncharacterized protein n=1 Tax=Glycine soja TaxID=3848 RepID=A0A445FU33_GLYSO|nr:hypothetical protein D0Y65_048702 [Glycine soja]
MSSSMRFFIVIHLLLPRTQSSRSSQDPNTNNTRGHRLKGTLKPGDPQGLHSEESVRASPSLFRSMLIDYVKFLQLQVKVLSMSRLGGAAAVAPLVAEVYYTIFPLQYHDHFHS